MGTWRSLELGKVKRRRGKELATLPHHAVALCMCYSTRHIPYAINYSMGLPLPLPFLTNVDTLPNISILFCQYFETDDPEFFTTKVRYIVENDVDDMELTFSEEVFNSHGKLEQVDMVLVLLLMFLIQSF